MLLLILMISGPDDIPVVVLKICEPELSYILAEVFNKCLKESCFQDCWKVSLVVPVFKNVGERSLPKNYCPVSLLSVFSKSLWITWNLYDCWSPREKAFCLISSMDLGLLNQLEIFWQLYLIEMLVLLIGLGLLKL